MNASQLLEFPSERLFALQNFKLCQFEDEETEFRKEWKKNISCECVLNLKRSQLPWCYHIKKEFDKKTKQKQNKLINRALVINIRQIIDLCKGEK
jgi:hypothetical protein